MRIMTMISEYRKQMKAKAREVAGWHGKQGQLQWCVSVFLSTSVLAHAIAFNWWYGGVVLTLGVIIVATMAYYVGQIRSGIEC